MALCASLLYTGLPQRKALEWAAAWALGAQLRTTGLQFLGGLRAQEITFGQPDAEPPVARIENAQAGYTLFSGQHRFITNVRTGPISITFQNSSSGGANYDFLQTFLDKPRASEKGASLAFIPRQWDAGPVSFSASMSDWGLELSGLQLSGEAPDEGPLRVQFDGEHLAGRGWTARITGADAAFTDGSAHITAVYGDGGFTLDPCYVNLPGLADASVVGRIRQQDENMRIEFDIDRIDGHGPYLAGLLSPILGAPVLFDGLHIDDTQVFGSYGPSGLHGLYVNTNVSIQNILLGPPQAPWFKGALGLNGRIEDKGGALKAVLNQSPPIRITLEGALPEAVLKAQFAGWTQKDLAMLLPESLRTTLDPGPDARIQASASVALEKDAAMVAVEAACAQAALMGHPLPGNGAILLKGALQCDDGFTKIMLENLQLDWPNAQLQLAGGPLERNPIRFNSPFTASFDVSALPEGLLGYPVRGAADITGQAELAASHIGIRLDAAVSGLGYGAFDASVYFPSVKLDVAMRYQPGSGIDIQALHAAWDASEGIQAKPFRVSLSPLAWDAPFTLQSGWTPLANSLPMEITGGGLQGAGACRKDGAGTRIEFDALRAQWDACSYDKGVVRMGSFDAMASEPVTFVPAIAGSGTLTLASATAAKATLSQLQGTWRCDAAGIAFEGLSAMLFNGSVSLDGRIGLLEAGRPGRMQATFKALDLARFTQEVQPSGVKLEGLADGDALAAWTMEGFQTLELHLMAPQGIRVNREFLEWLLMSQYMASESISDRTIRAVRESVLGGDVMRPFVYAEAQLKLEENEFRGPLTLKSDALSLTIDLSMDQASLLDIFEIGKLGASSDDTNVQWNNGAGEAPQ